MLTAPLAFGKPSGDLEFSKKSVRVPAALCPASPPPTEGHPWSPGTPRARAQQEGHLQGSVLMKFPSGHKGTCRLRGDLRSVRGTPSREDVMFKVAIPRVCR